MPSSRPHLAAALAVLPLALGCSSGSATPAPVPPAPVERTLDLGNGYLATLGSDGTLEVTRAGAPVLRTATHRALFTALHDAQDPGGWHDPTKLAGVAWQDALAGIGMKSPAPGQLELELPDQGADTALVSLALASDGLFASALGERYLHVDANNAVVPMHLAIDTDFESGTNDAHVPVPFLVSAGGYGVFVESREAGAFDVGVTEADVVRAAFEGRSMKVTLYFDPDPLAVVAAYTRTTGLPRRPPLWALAPMHWRNTWSSGAQVLADADAYRARHIPASTLWLDNPWQVSYNDATLDPARYGDVPDLLAQLAKRGFRRMVWSTPYLERPSGKATDEAQRLYDQAAPAGYFVSELDGKVWGAPGCCHKGLGMIDFTNPAAVAFWQGVLKNATGIGVAGFKLDYGEDLIPELFNSRLGTVRHDGESERTGRTYPLGYHAGYHGALDAAVHDGFLLGRASSYGGQAMVEAIWPGDLDSGFETRGGGVVGGLPAAVVAAQTLSMSGFPAFGSDTGGFRNGMPKREALLRWAEHTAFTVIMQLGGGGEHHNPWLYDEPAGAIYATLARAHLRLVPYLATLTRDASARGTPTLLPLPLAFPGDAQAGPFADTEYMLGPDLLVAPVVQPGRAARIVHFPPGAWVHWFDGTLVEGPAEVSVPAPLGTPAVFARVGALVPLYPEGIDTLVDATEPGVVTLAMKQAVVEARAFVAGHGQARFEEGSTLTVDGAAGKVTLAWAPVAPVKAVFVELDLRKSGLAHAVKVRPSLAAGGAVAVVADEAAARACAAPCFAQDAKAGKAWLSLAGKGSVVLDP